MKNALLKRNQKIIFNEEDDIGLLFNPDSGRVNTLNETGKFIWSRLDGKTTKERIVDEVSEEFDIEDKEIVKNDLDKFINELGMSNFIEDYIYIPPLQGMCFGITSLCNLSCKHCLNRNLGEQELDMTTEKLLSVIDEMYEIGIRSLSLFGGEPLAHPDFKKIVEYLNGKNMNISLNTNASLIDLDMAKWLKEHKVNGTVVSFDGSNAFIMDEMRGKGAFQAAIKGIKALRSEGINVMLSATLNKINFRDIREMALLGKEIGGNSIRFNHVFFAGNSACFVKDIYLNPQEEKEAVESVFKMKEEFGDFINQSSSYLCQKQKLDKVKDYKPSIDKITIPSCGAAMSKCAIRPDGWVVPCEIIWHVKAGNLKERSLKEIWEGSSVMNSFRKPLEIDLNEIPECKGCKYQYLCFIGHRCYPYHYPGGIKNKALYCWKNDKKGTDTFFLNI
ncbi:MAG: PqqD family peptide modification chaperone [Candidatus Omnitrophota bacterium]